MVLELPGGLFGQQDVRETPTTTIDTSGTSYFSISGNAFTAQTEIISWEIANGANRNTNGNLQGFYASVSLPHGAIITGAVVYGSDATNTWVLYRDILDATTADLMASGSVDSEDTSITNPLIDNSTHKYFLRVALGDNDWVHGGRITYTT